MSLKPIPQLVLESIMEDDGFRDSDNVQMYLEYESMDDKSKSAIDAIFTRLCGWQMSTIIAAHKQGIEPFEVQ